MNKTICLIASGFLILATGCGRQDFKKAPDGTEYKVIRNSDGKKAVEGDILMVNLYAVYKDSVLFSSVEKSAPRFIPYDTAQLPPYFKEIHVGDSLVLRQSTDSLIKYRSAAPFMEAGNYLVQSFKIVKLLPSREAADSVSKTFEPKAKAIAQKDVINRIEKNIADNDSLVKADDKIIRDYMAKNNLEGTKTKWGTYVVIESAGTGPMLGENDVAVVNYTGRTFNDSTFDSNTDPKFGHPEPYDVDMSEYRGIIVGWIDGLKMMQKGTKGKLVIPSYLAYGAGGRPPKIGPNENLVFDIEVADVLTQSQYQEELDKKQKQMMQQRQMMQQLQQQMQKQQQQKQQQQEKK